MEAGNGLSNHRKQLPIAPEIWFTLADDFRIQMGLDFGVIVADFQGTKALQTDEASIGRIAGSTLFAL
jgi:hypothetical protein